jgi:hypothetical protein
MAKLFAFKKWLFFEKLKYKEIFDPLYSYTLVFYIFFYIIDCRTEILKTGLEREQTTKK